MKHSNFSEMTLLELIKIKTTKSAKSTLELDTIYKRKLFQENDIVKLTHFYNKYNFRGVRLLRLKIQLLSEERAKFKKNEILQ